MTHRMSKYTRASIQLKQNDAYQLKFDESYQNHVISLECSLSIVNIFLIQHNTNGHLQRIGRLILILGLMHAEIKNNHTDDRPPHCSLMTIVQIAPLVAKWQEHVVIGGIYKNMI